MHFMISIFLLLSCTLLNNRMPDMGDVEKQIEANAMLNFFLD